MQKAGGCLSGLLMLIAAVWAFQRAQGPKFIGIDFVQFWITGRHVASGGDARIYADDVRREILEAAWQEARSEGTDSRFYRAVDFRRQRSWESYSSPFLYAVFGVMAEIAQPRQALWYHYFVLSLPAVLVVLQCIVSSTSPISLRLMLSLILLWCVVLLGLEPIDGLLSSPPVEHFLRCLVASAILLVLLVWIPKI